MEQFVMIRQGFLLQQSLLWFAKDLVSWVSLPFSSWEDLRRYSMVLDGVHEIHGTYHIRGYWPSPNPNWGEAAFKVDVYHMRNATARLFHQPGIHLKQVEILYRLAPQHTLLAGNGINEFPFRNPDFFLFPSQFFFIVLHSIFINNNLQVPIFQTSSEEIVCKEVSLISK